mgnify:CR=1 FL=1
MDENIKLEDEELLFVGINPESRIKVLNDMGIFTVKDFLDADETALSELKNNGQTRNPFIVYQQILKYKYREQKMDRDIYLDREYIKSEIIIKPTKRTYGYTQRVLSSAPSDSTNRELGEGSINDALRNLGLYIKDKTFKQLYEYDKISMMEAIKLISQEVPKFEKLCDFYTEYYEKEIKKSTELTSEDKTPEELENMSEEELQQIIANNDQTIEENNVAIKKALVQRILAQQKTISEQQSEIDKLSSQKKEL